MNVNEQIRQWLKSGGVGQYREAVHLLRQSGIVEILRRKATPVIYDNGENVSVMAGQAHWSNGFTAALEHILYFEDMYKSLVDKPDIGLPDFGGKKQALKDGTVLEENLKKSQS